MSLNAWHLLAEMIEFPWCPIYADLVDRYSVQELADHGLIAIVRTMGGFPRLVPTNLGLHEYSVIN